ncbi:unnamed protein product [Arabidopsis lyrata]|nr:unnamed protein product [Arabidopsis lyrata]
MLRESRDATRVPRRCERASSAMLRESQLGDAARVPRCCKSAAMLQECRDAARVSRRCVRASSAMLRESQLGDAAREPAQRRCNSAAMLRECRDATREPARRCCESASSAMLQESQIGDAAREPARRCCERASSAMLQESQLSDAARVPRSCERASSAMLRESQLGDAAREPARRCCKRKLRRCESATTLRESQLGDTAREPARRCCVRVTILRECTVRRVRFDLVSTRCFFGDAAAWPWEIVAWFSGGKRGSARWICSGSAVSCLGRVVSLVRFVKNLRLVEEGVVVQLLVVQRPRGEPWFGECELAGQRRGISGSSWRGISGRPIITNCVSSYRLEKVDLVPGDCLGCDDYVKSFGSLHILAVELVENGLNEFVEVSPRGRSCARVDTVGLGSYGMRQRQRASSWLGVRCVRLDSMLA